MGRSSMRSTTRSLFLILAAVAIVLAGCGGGGPGSDGSLNTSGIVRVLLSDAPTADLSEVWVTILRVELVPEADGPVVALDSGELPGQFELLSLADNPLELGVVQAPAGVYQQVRLILAAEGHYILDAEEIEHELRVPSGAQTGVKVNFPDAGFVVTEGQTTLLLDFLAGPSVHLAGASGQWLMRPVIQGVTLEEASPDFGAIEGTVAYEDGTIPQAVNGSPPAVFVAGDQAESIGEIDPETGAFEIPSLLLGEYKLEVGWLGDEGGMADGGALLILTDSSAVGQIDVTVQADTTVNVDLTVRPDDPGPGGQTP